MLRLIGLALCLLLAGTQDPADKVKALVEKLESDDVAVREAAQRELAIVGRPALPALEKSLASAIGEFQQRLQGVIGQITAFGTPPLVTLEAKDRPLREIAGDLERQTGVPVRIAGGVAEVKVSVSASKSLLWKVVDDLCRAHGNLMYRIGERDIELVSARYRALPSADREGLRFVIDRFTWDRNLPPHDGSEFAVHWAVLTSPGARLLWMKADSLELKDDKGVEIANIPPGHMEFMYDGSHYALDSRRIGFGSKLTMRGRPSPEASTLVRCSGKVEILFAQGERIVGSVKEPLSRPASPAEGPYGLSIDRWRTREGWLTFELSAGYDAESVKDLPWRLGPFFVLRLKDGQRRSPYWHPTYRHEREGVRRGRAAPLNFEWDPGLEVASLDFVVPGPVLKVEIPFDFRDIPLR